MIYGCYDDVVRRYKKAKREPQEFQFSGKFPIKFCDPPEIREMKEIHKAVLRENPLLAKGITPVTNLFIDEHV